MNKTLSNEEMDVIKQKLNEFDEKANEFTSLKNDFSKFVDEHLGAVRNTFMVEYLKDEEHQDEDEEDADYAWWDSDLYDMFNEVASNFGGTIEGSEFWVSSSC